MNRCDMVTERTGEQCKRQGRYIFTDRYGETWVFCKQHFDAYRKVMA